MRLTWNWSFNWLPCHHWQWFPCSVKVKKCFGVLEKKVKFQKPLTSLRNTWEETREMFTAIQKFICAIYGSTKKTINEARFDLLYQKYQNQNKILDMSTLPPREPVLFLRVKLYCFNLEKSKCSITCPPSYYWPRLEWRWELNLDIWNIPQRSCRNFIRRWVWYQWLYWRQWGEQRGGGYLT